jgi:hypothetical protein
MTTTNTITKTMTLVGGLLAAGCTPAWASQTETASARNQGAEREREAHHEHRRRRGWEIRAYDVPAEAAERYRVMARTLLRSDGKRSRGHATVAPDGRLVVFASSGVHEDLAKLLAEPREVPAEPAAISVTYWVVGAKRATGEASAPTDPGLKEVRSSLDALSKREGGLSFRLLDTVALRSSTDDLAEHDGERTDVRQSLRTEGGRLVAELRIRTRAAKVGQLATRLDLVPDKPVVVGETAIADSDERLIYLVRADTHE